MWLLATALGTLSIACTGDPDSPEDPDDLTMILSDHIPTVGTVTWTVDADATAAEVEFGLEEFTHRADATINADGLAKAVLLGMKPSSTYLFRVKEVVGGETTVGATHEVDTGAIPTEFPGIDSDLANQDMSANEYILAGLVPDPAAAVILDGDGDIVWWHEHVDDLDWPDHFVSRAWLSYTTGEPTILYHWQRTPPEGEESSEQFAIRVSLDGEEIEVRQLPYSHHDMLEHDDGTLVLLDSDLRFVDEYDTIVRGDRIIELSLDDEVTEVWSVWDEITYDPTQVIIDEGTGWTHANAIDYDAEQDVYYLSMRNLDSIFKIDRRAAMDDSDYGDDVVWKLGGYLSDFHDTSGQDTFFVHQHQFEILDDTHVIVFDDGSLARPSSFMPLLEMETDASGEFTGIVETPFIYIPDPELYCMAYGDVHRLDNGNFLVVFSSNGQIDEITSQGTLVKRHRTDLGAVFTYVQVLDDLNLRQP